MLGKKNNDAGDIPFRLRFKAWWDGLDAAELMRIEQEKTGIENAEANPNSITIDPIEKTIDPIRKEEPDIHWTDDRLSLCNRLWGGKDNENVVLPGGTGYTINLAKPMALDSSKTMLDLCAGQGGGTRRIVKEFQLWGEGMESDPVLAEKAHALSVKLGLEKKAPIIQYDPEKFTLREGRYDGILVRESMFRVANKRRMLKVLLAALKPLGHLIITDYAYRQESSASHKAVATWLKHFMPEQPKLWTLADYKKAVIDLGMDLHIHDEKTDEYRHMVLEGWSQFVGDLKKDQLSRQFVNLLMDEAQYWLRLTRAFESGEICYMRIHATRRSDSV